MPIVDTDALKVIERLPGWRGRFFHTDAMTFVHYAFDAGSTIHEHHHPEEEVYEVLDGEIEITIDRVTSRARPGLVAIVPADVRHSVKALTDGRLIVIDHPARRQLG